MEVQHIDLLTYTRAEIKEAILYNRKRAEKGRESGEHYRVDRNDASRYLDHKPWRIKIERYLSRLQHPVYVDVCGRATGESLGAQKSYTFSLQSRNSVFSWGSSTVVVEGDLFNAKDFGSLLRLLQESNDNPALVTFVPIAGLQRYTPTKRSPRTREKIPAAHHAVTWQRLTNNLHRMLRVLKPGGYIYLERPFQLVDLDEFFLQVPRSQARLVLWVKAFCAEAHCEVEIVTGSFGPKFLIHKPGHRKSISRRFSKGR